MIATARAILKCFKLTTATFAMSKDLVEIIHELRMQLAQRGQASIRTLGIAFKVND
jgi:hypothetical protein